MHELKNGLTFEELLPLHKTLNKDTWVGNRFWIELVRLDNLIDLSKGNVSSGGKWRLEIPGWPTVDKAGCDIGFIGPNQCKVGP